MADNIKIRTEDVDKILDTKITTISSHLPLDVSAGEYYNSVLGKIAARSPTFDEKNALTNASMPSAANPYVTVSHLNLKLDGRIPWKTVGHVGSGSDYEGSTGAVFETAISQGHRWITVRPGTYVFSETVSVPQDTYIMGASESTAILTTSTSNPVFSLGENCSLEYLKIVNTMASQAAMVATGDNLNLRNVAIAAEPDGCTLNISSGIKNICITSCKFEGGSLLGTSVSQSILSHNIFDCPGTYAVNLVSPSQWSITSNVFKNGQLRIDSGSNTRVVGNHLNDGGYSTNPVLDTEDRSTVLFRANTPNSNNNEVEDFNKLLEYVGSTSVLQGSPIYSNNYAGPAGENLTARAGALDLLLQWRYEERNFHLVGDTENTTVAWNPVSRQVSTSGPLRLISSHREAYWILPQLGSYTSVTYASQTSSSGTVSFTGSSAYLGQTFQSPYSGTISSVTVKLSRASGATGSLHVRLYNVTGVAGTPAPADSSLGSSAVVNFTSLSTTETDVTFTFSSPISVAANSYYAVVLVSSSTFSAPLNVSYTNNPNAYNLGSVIASQNSGATWSATVSQDLYMVVSGRTLSAITLNSGDALYYKLDRNLNTENITLVPFIDPVGSIINDASNRQVYVLAYCLGTSLWWRGGGGSRFPGTADQTGTYFIDGSSKSMLDYIGAVDYNDYDPLYNANFAGVESESLTVRVQKQDQLLRTLYEYNNRITELPNDGYLGYDGSQLTLSGTLTYNFSHNAGKVYVAPQSWTISDGQLLYLSWTQDTLSSSTSQSASAVLTTNGSLPLPNNYPNRTKYFAFARRKGTSLYLWDGTELISGGRWPVPIGFGRQVIPTAGPTTLTDNIVWTGTDLLWEKLALVTSTGLPLARNTLADQTTVSASLTTLASGQGLLITHTWNPGSNQNVTVERVSLPITRLKQNQFLWVQNFSGTLVFGT